MTDPRASTPPTPAPASGSAHAAAATPVAPAWPLGFVTVDVDGLWALRSCYAQPRGDTFERDPVWSQGVPWLLDVFDALRIRATFFIVASDLEIDSKRAVAEEILRRGHEIANHSLSHRIGLTRQPMGDLMEDLLASQQMFEETLGIRPTGFRSPGYDVDARLLRAVRRAGFAYDSSLLPTWWGPLFRMADWWVARRVNLRKRQFGRFRYGWAPLRPYRPWKFGIRNMESGAMESGESTGTKARDSTAGPSTASVSSARSSRDASAPSPLGPASAAAASEFWEIPISVTPGMRLPVGAGYVLMAGKGYLPRALHRFQRRRLPFTFLIHGADVTDLRSGDARVFPSRWTQPAAAAFALDPDTKRRRVERALRLLAAQLELQRMGDWVGDRLVSLKGKSGSAEEARR